MIVNKV